LQHGMDACKEKQASENGLDHCDCLPSKR